MLKEFDVISIENTLMDVLIQVDDSHLVDFNLKKGTFHLIDETTVNLILKKYEHTQQKLTPAGAGANTIMGIANLGGKCVLIGRVGKDPHGDVYEEVITKDKIKSNIIRCDRSGTGRCFSFITPDAERTFAVHLGAAINLEKENILEDDIKKSKVLYLTGYIIENAKDIALHALEIAKKNDVLIALDLADAGIIKRHKEELKRLVKQYADIVFVNELEAPAFTDKEDPEEALQVLSRYTPLAVVKLGEKGSLIKKDNEILHTRDTGDQRNPQRAGHI